MPQCVITDSHCQQIQISNLAKKMNIRPILKSLLVPRVTQRIKRNCRIRAVFSFIQPFPQRNHHAESIYVIIWVSKRLASLVCEGSRNYENNSDWEKAKSEVSKFKGSLGKHCRDGASYNSYTRGKKENMAEN